MSYFIVDKATGRKYRKPAQYGEAHFNTEKGAKTSLTRLVNSGQLSRDQWTVMSHNEHREKFPVKMVEKTNLMTGQKFMEAEDTPYYCSPSSETYWAR